MSIVHQRCDHGALVAQMKMNRLLVHLINHADEILVAAGARRGIWPQRWPLRGHASRAGARHNRDNERTSVADFEALWQSDNILEQADGRVFSGRANLAKAGKCGGDLDGPRCGAVNLGAGVKGEGCFGVKR
jgi:hypothetical protein